MSAGALMTAAASPLWVPTLLAGKKRRKREDHATSNEINVNQKPIAYHAKMVQAYLNQAREAYQQKKKSN